MTSGEHTKGHTELRWQDAAEQICTEMESRVAVTARRAAETLYETILTSTQDYLRENVNYNLQSELSSLRSTCGRLRKEAAMRESAVAELVEALHTILANTEADAIPHIAHDGLTAYQSLAKDISDCAFDALTRFREAQAGGGA